MFFFTLIFEEVFRKVAKLRVNKLFAPSPAQLARLIRANYSGERLIIRR